MNQAVIRTVGVMNQAVIRTVGLMSQAVSPTVGRLDILYFQLYQQFMQALSSGRPSNHQFWPGFICMVVQRRPQPFVGPPP